MFNSLGSPACSSYTATLFSNSVDCFARGTLHIFILIFYIVYDRTIKYTTVINVHTYSASVSLYYNYAKLQRVCKLAYMNYSIL